jgi:hypothetical protein
MKEQTEIKLGIQETMNEFILLVPWLPHKILQRETHRGHRPAQFHRAARGDGQRASAFLNKTA